MDEQVTLRVKRELRIQKVTQERLAKALGYKRAGTVNEILNKKGIDSIEFLQVVCSLTGKPLNYFLTGEEGVNLIKNEEQNKTLRVRQIKKIQD